MRKLKYLHLLILFATTLLLTAQELPPADPTQVRGDIVVGGSVALVDMSETIAVRYALDGFLDNIAVVPYPMTEAFQRFCGGELDIVLADRQITPAEASNCAATGRSPIAMRVATDAVSVGVNPLNNFVENLTAGELQQIFSGAPNWSDIRPDWPGEIIARYGPGPTSVGVDLFSAVVFGGDARLLTTAIGIQLNDDPIISLSEVTNNQYGIGFFRTTFVNQNGGLVRVIPIDGVSPTIDKIYSAEYPLSRPLFLYTSASVMAEKAQVADFLNYYISNLDLEVGPAGLLPASPELIQVTKNTWLGAMGQDIVAIEATATALADVPQTEATPPPSDDSSTSTETSAEVEVDEIQPQPRSEFGQDTMKTLVNGRTDLEIIATELLGIQRPPGWSGSLDVTDPQLAIKLRLDVELLAAIVYGIESYPDDWFGVVPSSQGAMIRDIRHDIELLADAVFPEGVERPSNWAGDNPLYSRDRSTQALAQVLERGGVFTTTVDPSSDDYCAQVSQEAAQFTEVNLLSNAGSSISVTGASEGAGVASDIQVQTRFAVAFGSRNATPRMGVVPQGEPIVPVARSYTNFSKMTLVEGDGFRVFIDYSDTNLTAAQWEQLPNEAEAGFEAFCDASWCG